MDDNVDLVVMRCNDCGDTFPTSPEGEEEVKCRSCGSADLGVAHEPLL